MFLCLRKDHISLNCPSKSKCYNCNGKHHVSICQTKLNAVTPTYPETTVSTPVPQDFCLLFKFFNTSVTSDSSGYCLQPSTTGVQGQGHTLVSTDERLELVDVAALEIELKGELKLSLSAFTVPLICQPLQGQPVKQVVNDNACFSGLRLADQCWHSGRFRLLLVSRDWSHHPRNSRSKSSSH